MFETHKSGIKTSLGAIGLNIGTHASPQVVQDRVSGGVSVLCWHTTPVAIVLWKRNKYKVKASKKSSSVTGSKILINGGCLCIPRKRKRSDPVLCQKSLHRQKNPKSNVTTQKTLPKTSITQRLRTGLGRSVGVTRLTIWYIRGSFKKFCYAQNTT